MKLIVCIVVYDRIDNIERWINCWQQCEHLGAEFIILHNYYGDEPLLISFKTLCDKNNITYIPRNDTGMDIGAFRDVCFDKQPGFPTDWTHILWVCDDCLPMSKTFLKPFIDLMQQKDVAVTCMEISPWVRKHIRTTGFMIKKEAAQKLVFPNPLLTKKDCFVFEHYSQNNFYDQIIKMHYKVTQVSHPSKSPMWDIGYHRRLPRMTEFINTFGIKRKIVFICPIYDAFPEIVSSLICQTYRDWELLLIHDGENDLQPLLSAVNDSRITYIKRPRIDGKWGHHLRRWALDEIKAERLAKDADFVTITNGDNYHTPVYCEYMLKGFADNEAAVAVYCKQMVHSYVSWGVLNCVPKLGFIDCAGVMVRKRAALEVGWRDESHSSDFTYFSDIIAKFGKEKFIPINGSLIIHN